MIFQLNALNSSWPPVPSVVMKNFHAVTNAWAHVVNVAAINTTLFAVSHVRSHSLVDISVDTYVVSLVCHVRRIARPNVLMGAVNDHVENCVNHARNRVQGSAFMPSAAKNVEKIVIVTHAPNLAWSPCHVDTGV